MTLRHWLPALVTLVVLACGLGALEATRVADWDLALGLVVIAAIADGVDGQVARWLHVAGPMGKQLDSLSDVIAFGMAPAFSFATRYSDAPTLLRFGVALAFVGSGVFRLARFNVKPHNDAFCGLPITCAGVLLTAAVALPFPGAMVSVAVVGITLATLMVSHIPFSKLTTWRWIFLVPVVAAAIPIALWPTAETVALVAIAMFGAYAGGSVVVWLVQKEGRGIADGRRDNVPAGP